MRKRFRAAAKPFFKGLISYEPKIAFRSSSGVLMGLMLNLSTSTFSTFGVTKAGGEDVLQDRHGWVEPVLNPRWKAR